MAHYQFVLISKCKIIVLFCVLSGNLLKRFDANKQISLSLISKSYLKKFVLSKKFSFQYKSQCLHFDIALRHVFIQTSYSASTKKEKN